MAWTDPNSPNLADFTSFVTDSMAIPVSALPTNSVWIGYAFNQAMDLVFGPPWISGLSYTLAVYNCAGHLLLFITPDQTGQTYFADARAQFDLLSFRPGAIDASGDQGTNSAFATPEQLRSLTVGDLDFLKTPWGRAYLAYAMDFGPIGGIT